MKKKGIKMKTKVFMIMAAAALVMAGCSNDENEVADNRNSEIRLSSGVSVQTRAFDGMDTQLPDGRTVAVYVDKTGGTPQLYGNNVLTADGNGSFKGGTTMYFPEDKSAVDIYAFHTNGTLAEAFPATAVTHAVEADQSGETNYLKSDLLYSVSKNNAVSKTAIPLTFYHMLAKVQVAIKAGAGTPNLDGATVSIIGTRLKADFTPDKSADINNATPATAQAARAGMIAVTTTDNAAADIKLSNTVTTGTDFTSAVYNDAVIVPQTVAQGSKFIKVKLSNGSELFHKLANGTTFESGKKYQYQITVDLIGLTVTSTVVNWDSVNPVSGSAEME